MTTRQETAPPSPPQAETTESRAGSKPILDLSGIDLSARIHSRSVIESVIPHRGHMLLLDAIVWENPGYTEGVAVKHVTENEFWVPGHFPQKAMLPGVLMIEAGAQVGCYCYMRRRPNVRTIAFLRIENAAFRSMVEPGDDLFLLCKEIKFGRRNFKSDIQGIVGDRICFDATITGMEL